MKLRDIKLITAVLLVLIGVAGRILPHVWNFTPIIAISLFSALYLGRKYAIAIPLTAMIVSDIFIGFYNPMIMISVYGSFAFIGAFAFLFKGNKKTERVIFLSLLSSTLFFIITNFAVWMFSGMYSLTFSGLIQSYLMGVPFYRNALLGDLFYTGVIFISYAVIQNMVLLRKNKRVLII